MAPQNPTKFIVDTCESRKIDVTLARRSGALDVLDRHIDITFFTRSDPTNVLLAVTLPSAHADVWCRGTE